MLAEECNMKYTHITMDCGAAMNVHHVLWNNPNTFSDVILHLCDFHAMMEIFNTIGTIVAEIGLHTFADNGHVLYKRLLLLHATQVCSESINHKQK